MPNASQPLSNGAGRRRAAIVGNEARAIQSFGNPALNKSVVVSEEALVAPVTVPDVTAPSASKQGGGAGLCRAGGISFSHFLNDTMQSLIPSVYPILKASYALDFAQIGMITLAFQFTASLLQPVVGHFTDRKAQPFSLAIGMGFDLLRPAAAQRRAAISGDPDRGGAGRPGLGGVPSGVGAHRAARLGRPLRFRAIGVSARRQLRNLDGAVARGADRRAVRPAQHRLVLLDRVSRDRHPVADRPLVQAADHYAGRRRRSIRIRMRRARAAS